MRNEANKMSKKRQRMSSELIYYVNERAKESLVNPQIKGFRVYSVKACASSNFTIHNTRLCLSPLLLPLATAWWLSEALSLLLRGDSDARTVGRGANDNALGRLLRLPGISSRLGQGWPLLLPTRDKFQQPPHLPPPPSVSPGTIQIDWVSFLRGAFQAMVSPIENTLGAKLRYICTLWFP